MRSLVCNGRITFVDRRRIYRIGTLSRLVRDVPEIKVVLINRSEVGKYGQGSEAAANALAALAIAGAFLDATGKVARRSA